MIEFTPQDEAGRRVLLTPGPLTTTRTVREAMLDDIGSWDKDCIELVRDIRFRLVALAGGRDDLTCTLIQGSGTYGNEAMLGSVIPRTGKLLVLNNGAYGRRMATIARTLGIDYLELVDPEDQPNDPSRIDEALAADPSITHVVCVHCETTTGLVNPLREIGLAVQKHSRRFLVDAISSFGAYSTGPGRAIDFDAGPIDHLTGSANKCIEGVPGFAFVLSRRASMAELAGRARSVALDLYDQWNAFEAHGKFRFTPPTHVMLAFRQALIEMEQGGGVAAREARYRENHKTLVEGMARLGFNAFIAPELQSHIITTFLYPNPNFDFDAFYNRLRSRGYIIYPGKLTDAATFRIGNIGSIAREEIEGLLLAISEIMASKGGLEN